jgi:hypothetical protein
MFWVWILLRKREKVSVFGIGDDVLEQRWDGLMKCGVIVEEN